VLIGVPPSLDIEPSAMYQLALMLGVLATVPGVQTLLGIAEVPQANLRARCGGLRDGQPPSRLAREAPVSRLAHSRQSWRQHLR